MVLARPVVVPSNKIVLQIIIVLVEDVSEQVILHFTHIFSDCYPTLYGQPCNGNICQNSRKCVARMLLIFNFLFFIQHSIDYYFQSLGLVLQFVDVLVILNVVQGGALLMEVD